MPFVAALSLQNPGPPQALFGLRSQRECRPKFVIVERVRVFVAVADGAVQPTIDDQGGDGGRTQPAVRHPMADQRVGALGGMAVGHDDDLSGCELIECEAALRELDFDRMLRFVLRDRADACSCMVAGFEQPDGALRRVHRTAGSVGHETDDVVDGFRLGQAGHDVVHDL